jgi:hypothetical protein
MLGLARRSVRAASLQQNDGARGAARPTTPRFHHATPNHTVFK